MTARALSLALLAGLSVTAARLPAPPLPAGTTTGLGSLEKYLVEDTTLVGVANVKTVAASPLHAKLKKEVAALAEHEMFAKYLKPFGVKPVQDIERIVLVMGTQKERQRNFNDPPGENDERMYFLFQGKFDPTKVEPGFNQLAKDHPNEVKVAGKGEAAILEMGRGGSFFALIDRTTFIIAPSKKIVEQVRDRASGKNKARFTSKDFPALLKDLKSETAIDAVGSAGMQIDSKFEQLGNNGYKLTPITLEQKGFKKLTVRVELKDGLSGKVVMATDNKATAAAMAKAISDGLEQQIRRADQRAKADPFEQVMMGVLKGVKVTATDQGVVMEGKVSEATAKEVLEGMKKLFDALSQLAAPRGKP